jgi:hypothetical protein
MFLLLFNQPTLTSRPFKTRCSTAFYSHQKPQHGQRCEAKTPKKTTKAKPPPADPSAGQGHCLVIGLGKNHQTNIGLKWIEPLFGYGVHNMFPLFPLKHGLLIKWDLD